MKGDEKMKGLSIESCRLWYEPEMEIHPFGDYSEYKQKLIAERFEAKDVESIPIGSYIDDGNYRITVIDIED